MVKSTGCFNIIACGKKDSVDRDDLEAPEIKSPSDRRGWSFRKRSARDRVLSNTASSGIPSSVNKESPESDVSYFQTKPELAVQDKTSSIQWTEEKSDLPNHPDSKLSSNTEKEDEDNKVDVAVDESSVIIIQAASRGFLARKLLLKQKNVIKLQAAVRGHLVRTQAIGTLRCVQAIIKMQALVRERRARLECNGNDDGKNKIKPNATYTYVSLEKLLRNTFACQLMESTPKTTSIRIKCEPLKSDSAWIWLERWMSASSVSDDEPEESEPVIEHVKKENREHNSTYPESTDFKSDKNVSVKESENDDDLISYEANSLDLKAHKPTTLDPNHSSKDEPKSDPIAIEERGLESSKVEVESPYTKRKEADTKLYMPDSKRSSIEQPDETEVKKLSRKASNPAFIAAQSKFEELSLASKSITSSSVNESGVKPSLDKVSSYTDLQIGGSECGTELSISSTLDSPDRSEITVSNESELKAKDSDENDVHISTEHHEEIEANGDNEYSQIKDNDRLTLPEADPSYPDSNKSEKVDTIMSSTVESSNTLQDQKPEADQIKYNQEIGSEVSHVTCNKSSPEASPRSHMTMPESQATPSSQVSVKPKKSKGEKSKSNGKIKSSSSPGDKKAPLNRHLDSASSKNSSEHNKTGKRRNSFGSDHKEQEPRDSSSSNSLPSYMQATESARAKAISNGSPRSSPDVDEKDVYLRKRHSLPGAHERHESPRIQRSLSQAQQNLKGNGTTTQSPQDRKWRR